MFYALYMCSVLREVGGGGRDYDVPEKKKRLSVLKGRGVQTRNLQLSFIDAYSLWRVVSLRLNIEAIPEQFVSVFRADYTRHTPGFPFFNLLQPLVNCQRGITSTHTNTRIDFLKYEPELRHESATKACFKCSCHIRARDQTHTNGHTPVARNQ